MKQHKFNPQQWLQSADTTIQPAQPKDSAQTAHIAQYAQGNIIDDIEIITQRIEAASKDIAPDYTSWRDLGFALADALGENGRSYYHRLSRFYPEYNPTETDKQYDRCIRAHGTGITIKTLFQLAKDQGINLATKPIKAKETTPVNTADSADIPEELLSFSPAISVNLPDFLKKIAQISTSPQDSDILILGTMTVISACLPHITGIYAGRTIHPNLFLFVTARASSGKGRLGLCRHIVEPIHDRLREINDAEVMDYKHRLAEYNAAGKKKVDLEKPEEPPMRMLFIPANSSATAVYQVLGDNGGEGLMFETEGDTLANTFSSDYGNYSDGFRKAFHHESISYIRRKDREYVNIKNPRLSTLLTGTPRQVLNLITDAENGLFSRFIFYHMNIKPVWNDVFQTATDITLDEYFQALGQDYYHFHTLLQAGHDLRFTLTPAQAAQFNASFEAHQDRYSTLNGDEFIATVRRLGLITYRIAMILTALRIMEHGNFEDNLICSDTDFSSALTIAEVLLQHSSHVFNSLPKVPDPTETQRPAQLLKQQFLDDLPSEFDRPTYHSIALAHHLNPRTIDRQIARWVEDGHLTKLAQGKYRKADA